MYTTKIHTVLKLFRFEFMVIALMILIFDRIFFQDMSIYLRYIWPLNMVIISIASFGIFTEKSKHVKLLRNIFSIISIAIPFAFLAFYKNMWFIKFLNYFYIVYYIYIFQEMMKQITRAQEIKFNVIIGTFCGFMLISMVSLHSLLSIELIYPKSFHGISYGDVGSIYSELSYFSLITLTSIGYGDIYALTDTARMTTAFFGMLGQFYMVAVVGIVISRFTSNQHS